jgi:hypothetical protein
MGVRKMIRFSTAMVLVIGFVLLVATGRVASALGAQSDGVLPGATDAAAMRFWFQLAFIRLFGTALVCLGVVLLWCQMTLSASQQVSLAKVLAPVMLALTLIAGMQQIAIWNSNAGWVLTAALLSVPLGCLLGIMRATPRHAA